MNTTHQKGPVREVNLAAPMKRMHQRTKSCPAATYGLAAVNVSQVVQRASMRRRTRRGLNLTAAASALGRGRQQASHGDTECLRYSSQVVDRPSRPAPEPHGQRRLAQAYLSGQGLLTDTSASHPGAHLCGHPQAQLIHCALSHGSTIGGWRSPRTHQASRSIAPSSEASSLGHPHYRAIA